MAVVAPGYGDIGWLNRGDGAQYLVLLRVIGERHLPLQCPAEMHKGSDGALGVRLDLATPATIAAKLNVPWNDIANRTLAAAGAQAKPSGTGSSAAA